jgi:quinol monooxygenase YgiN
MVLIHVSVKPKGNTIDAFERILCEVMDDARKTVGCTKYEWYLVPDPPRGYAIFGEFRNGR